MNVVLVVVGVIVALVVIGVLALVAFNYYCGRILAKEEAQIRLSGRPAMAVLVMANSRLLSGEVPMAAALIAVDLGPEPEEHADALRALAARTYELYVLPDSKVGSLGRHEQSLALHAKDHHFEHDRRYRVPEELSGGREIYLLDIYLDAERMRPNTGTTRLIPCMVTGRAQGQVMQLPWREPGAKRLFERYENRPGSSPANSPSPAAAAVARGRVVEPLSSAAARPPQAKLGSGKFAVALSSYDPLDPEDFSPILADALGILPYDAVAMTRDARGILVERGVSGEVAEDLVASLGEAGVEAVAFPLERLVKIGKPVQVRELVFEEDGFRAQMGYSATPRFCPHEALVLASGGWIVETRKRPTVHRRSSGKRKRGMGFMQVVGGLSFGLVGAAIGAKAEKALNEAKRAREKSLAGGGQAATEVGLADLFVREPAGSFLHLRLRNRDLYYPKILGEEAVADFQVNFSQVLCRILNGAPEAGFNKGLEFMISEDAEVDPDEAEFGSEKEFTAFTRWLLQITEISDLLPKSSPEDDELEGTPFSLVEDEVPASAEAPGKHS